VREVLSLAGPRKTVRDRAPAVHALVRVWWLAAGARLRIAGQLDPETEFAPAVALYREGISALIGASVVAVEGEVLPADVVDIRTAWGALERIWPRLDLGVDLGEFATARRALCEAIPLDGVPPEKAATAAACGEMARLVALLERAIEPRTARELAAYSAMRIAAVMAVLVVALVISVKRLLAPVDLALNKPVTQSTVLSTRAEVGGAYLTNGRLEYSYGAATDNSPDAGHADPWIMVDLQRPTRVGKIAVYNRGDVNFTDCLPLILEIGADLSSMKVLDTRKVLFTRTEPWVIDHLDETIRYVRVRMTGNSYIVLDEIEVYAP